MNQCDGCRRKLRLNDGLHYDAMGPVTGCTADRYVAPRVDDAALLDTLEELDAIGSPVTKRAAAAIRYVLNKLDEEHA